MATISGEFSKSINNGYQQVIVKWSATTDDEHNCSTVTADTYFKTVGSVSIGSRSNSTTIDGHTTSWSSSSLSGSGKTWKIGSVSVIVDHDETTGKKTIAISSVFNIQATISGTYYSNITASKSGIELPTIAVKTTISSVSSCNIGSATTISIDRKNTNYKTKIFYKLSGDNSWKVAVDKTTASPITWTIPSSGTNSFYNNMSRTDKTISCQFYAETFNASDVSIGNTQDNPITQSFTAVGDPTVSTRTGTDINSVTANLTSNASTSTTKMVKYASNIRVNVTATAVNGATIKKITVNGSAATLDGSDTSVTRNGVITFNGATSNTYSIVVTDSRDHTKTYSNISNTLEMITYVPLSITTDSNIFKRNTPTDGKINISIRGNAFDGSFRTNVSNTLIVYYRWKQSGASSWNQDWTSSGLSVSKSGNTYTATKQLTGMDYTKSFIFEAKVVDSVNTSGVTANNITVPKGTPVYWWDNDEFNVNGTFGVGGASNLHGLTNNGGLTNKGGVELYGSTPYIDFHYNNSTSDYTSRIIENESGKLEVSGKMQIDNGIFSRATGQVGTPVGNSCLVVKRASSSEAPNNGVVLEFGNSTNYTGQLFIGDNATQGIYYNGWSGGTRGSWKRLCPEESTTGTDSSPFDSVSTGSFVSLSYAKFGKMIEINMRFKSTSSVSAGSNAFVGVIKSAYRPKINTTGSSYNAARGMIGNLETDGTLTIRVVSGTLSNNVESGISFTYIV